MPESQTSALPQSLRFDATLAGVGGAAAGLRRLLDAQGLDRNCRYNVEVVFEEIALNIIRHGSPTRDIEVAVVFGANGLHLMFEDDGVPFDPRQRPDPPAPTSFDEALGGGSGLVLVKKIVTRIDYERTPEPRNRLTLTIPCRPGPQEVR